MIRLDEKRRVEDQRLQRFALNAILIFLLIGLTKSIVAASAAESLIWRNRMDLWQKIDIVILFVILFVTLYVAYCIDKGNKQ
jgi:uncharacterized membrane protein